MCVYIYIYIYIYMYILGSPHQRPPRMASPEGRNVGTGSVWAVTFIPSL